MYLVQYARNLERLLETPEELPIDRRPPKYHLKAMLRRAAREGREVLTERESKKILETYGILSPEIPVAGTASKAKKTASSIGFPVVLKINSPDITHKSVAGGVALNISSESQIQEKFDEILSNAQQYKPSADIQGVTVQKMISDVDLELILGSNRDPVFRATLMFGRGGRDVEYVKDISIGLPPLNQTLARMMMEDTTIYEQLKETKQIASEDFRTLERYLLGLSQLIIDFPEIKELDVNPLAVTENGILALDARVIIDKELALEKRKLRIIWL
ncbi:MAG: hypothetical protein GWO20_14245 [Candidatus Korarchaeota archaeon]|nr:hypothetical protein [Candidatus Korarchaeota archaeon]NIU84576.1 hypothetical protein [Candidatus Thorarchaeota archaeon]NIW14634.1 hypothetical protein [Candidatus Thorarchaeota archaeon]NIW52711.1 hypothetical protein [Candidatus Korarchaeota archaeon]